MGQLSPPHEHMIMSAEAVPLCEHVNQSEDSPMSQHSVTTTTKPGDICYTDWVNDLMDRIRKKVALLEKRVYAYLPDAHIGLLCIIRGK